MSFSKISVISTTLVIATLLTILILPLFTLAQETKPQAKAINQKLVKVRVDGGSFLLIGDSLIGTDKALDGGALPFLVERGWRIETVHMTASAGVNPEQHAALVLLTK